MLAEFTASLVLAESYLGDRSVVTLVSRWGKQKAGGTNHC